MVPMVGLVPVENDVIPMVLLIGMHLIKEIVRLIPIEKHVIPMVHHFRIKLEMK